MSLNFVGLGLHDERGLSLRGLEEARAAELVFIELYTSRLPALSLERLEQLIGKSVRVLKRSDLEEDSSETLKAMAGKRCVLLVPGDPLVNTTHTALRLEAERRGMKTGVVHAASITSAVAGATGLQSSKFGRTVSMPIPRDAPAVESPYLWIFENISKGLHTLVLLEMDLEANRYLTIAECITVLRSLEALYAKGIARPQSLAIGLARIGSEDFKVKADRLERLAHVDFGEPPHSIVFPSRLHFVEVDALKVFAHAPDDALEGYR